ncbi:mechanosensitive ion channel domain-containing protein [Vibrio sp. PNB23_22_7]
MKIRLNSGLHKIYVGFFAFVFLVTSAFVTAQNLPKTDFLKSEITRLNNESPKDKTKIAQYETLLKEINAFATQQSLTKNYQNVIHQFPAQKKQLLEQIAQANSLDIFNTTETTNYNDLWQSISSLQAAINQWQITLRSNAQNLTQLNEDRKTLPVSLAKLNQEIEKATLVKTDKDTIIKPSSHSQVDQWLAATRLKGLKLKQAATSMALQSLDERFELLQLKQQLLEKKLELASPVLEKLQNNLTKLEQASVKVLIAEAKASAERIVDPSKKVQQDIDQLRQRAGELESVLLDIDDTRVSTQQYQLKLHNLSEEQSLVRENIAWLKNSPAFGTSLRVQLRRLPKKVEDRVIPDKIAHAHIRKYELTQLLDKESSTSTQENDDTPAQPTDRINILSKQLLEKLIDDYEKLIIALSKLQVSINQYALEVENARNFLKEQQLWARSNPPLWQNMAHFDPKVWFGTSHPISSMSERLNRSSLLFVSILVLTYTLILFYLRRKSDAYSIRLSAQYKKVYGHPIKDRFQNSVSLLLLVICRAFILPIWFACTAMMLYWLWPSPNFNDSKVLMMASAFALFALELIHGMSEENGLLEVHLKWPSKVCTFLNVKSNQLCIPITAFLLTVTFAEVVANNEQAEVSRLLFLILITIMTFGYLGLLKSDRISLVLPAPLHKGVGFFLLKGIILGSFIAIIILSVMGLSVASWLFLVYQQMTIFLLLGGLFIYQLGERWLKLEYRQLNYQRLLARREELIAQLHEQEEEPEEIARLKENLPDVDAQGLDSEEINEQSTTLLKGLSLIGLVIALLTLWSSALEMTSWLDKVIVWQVSEVISGSSTLVDVTLQSLIYAVITLLVTFVGIRNLPGILELLVLRKLELGPGTGYAITTLLRYLILMAGVMFAFSTLGFQWSRLQWLVAAFGVGLGFGLQEIFANFISGLILLFERPIRIGDIVTINDLSGTVSKIQTRATTIIDWDNKEIVVPNKTFITEKLINWSLSDSITRIVIPIGVAYGSDIEKVEQLLYDVAKEHSIVLDDPAPSVFFLSFGASSLDFELRVYINSIDHRLPTLHIINSKIDKLFKQHGIEISFPQMDVHVRDWPSNGDRPQANP